MARTREGALLTERHRLLQVRLTATALRDLLQLWGTVDPLDLAGTIGPFTKAAAIIVRAGRRASAAASSRYYTEFRSLEGIPGQVIITLATPLLDEKVEGGVRGAGLAGIVKARERGLPPEAAARNGFVKMAGSAASLVLSGGRDTLLDAIHGDRHALGYQRVTDASPCAFCRMVASRGAVFKSEGSASFQAHGHCGCTAEPYFENSRPLPANVRFRQEWDDATKGLKGDDALNAYRRHLAGQE